MRKKCIKQMPGGKCQPFACKIQVCLQNNNNDQDKCKEVIQQHLDCCIRTSINGENKQRNCEGFGYLIYEHFKKNKRC